MPGFKKGALRQLLGKGTSPFRPFRFHVNAKECEGAKVRRGQPDTSGW